MGAWSLFTRDFILIFFAQFTLSAAFNLLIPTLPLYLLRLGSTEAEIGILVGAASVSSLALRPLVGRALFRTPERNFMLAGAFLFAATSIAYLFAFPFWPLLIVRVLQGASVAFFYTASVTLVTSITPEAHRGRSLGYFYLSFNFAFAAAPSFGVFIIRSFSFSSLFLFCAALTLVSLLLTCRLSKTRPDSDREPSSDRGSFISFEAVPTATVSFFAHIIWGALTAFFPLYAVLHGVENPGFFFGACAITVILGRVFGGAILDLSSREKIIPPCLGLYILAMTILAFSKTLEMFILVAIIWGVGNAFLFPALVVCTLDRVKSSRGLAMGTFTAAGDLGIGLGSVLMGGLLRLSSYPVMFICLALTSAINIAYFHFFVSGKGQKATGAS